MFIDDIGVTVKNKKSLKGLTIMVMIIKIKLKIWNNDKIMKIIVNNNNNINNKSAFSKRFWQEL